MFCIMVLIENLKKFPKKKKEVLFVGRLVPEKGVHFYVDAIKINCSKISRLEF